MKMLKDRVRETRLKKKMTGPELAQKVGITATAIYSIENGRVHGSTKLVEIAAALGVSPEWLQHGEIKYHEVTSTSPVEVPILQFEMIEAWLARGELPTKVEYLTIYALREEQKLPTQGFAVSVENDMTMIGDVKSELRSGEYAMINPAYRDKNSGLFLIKAGEHYRFRQITRDGSQVLFIATNPHLPPLDEKDVTIIGEVFMAIRNFR